MTLAHDTNTPIAEVLEWSIETIAWVERANQKRRAHEQLAMFQSMSAALGNRHALVEIVAEAFDTYTAMVLDVNLQMREKD